MCFRLVPNEKTLEFFTEDPVLSEGVVKDSIKFDASKIIWYDGFNTVDPYCPAERACNHKVKRADQYKAYKKEEYADLLRKHVEMLQAAEIVNGQNRKRRNEHESAPPKNKKGRFLLCFF